MDIVEIKPKIEKLAEKYGLCLICFLVRGQRVKLMFAAILILRI